MFEFDPNKKATVLVRGCTIELGSFDKDEEEQGVVCRTYIAVSPQWVDDAFAPYLFGIRFLNGKLELLFDERPRKYHDPRVLDVRECRPADEASSRILRGLFEDKAYAGEGMFVQKVPLAWPW